MLDFLFEREKCGVCWKVGMQNVDFCWVQKNLEEEKGGFEDFGGRFSKKERFFQRKNNKIPKK